MRYLRKYESHEDKLEHKNFLNGVNAICQKYGIEGYTINNDGSVDVVKVVRLDGKNLTELPINFNKIDGSFTLQGNSLTSLKGCPKSIEGSFSCSDNRLTSLAHCPKYVCDTFFCHTNDIETFDGLDFVNIGGDFDCAWNPIWEVWRLFRDHTKFEFFNDCDPIRENRVIVLDRLNFFLDYINKPIVTEVRGYKCI
jgi:hypothetical protein